MMTDRFLRLPEVIDRSGLSRRTIYRRISEGTFPEAERIGRNAVAWREADLTAWMAAPTDWSNAA